jgi:gliding motility-associated-like protein
MGIGWLGGIPRFTSTFPIRQIQLCFYEYTILKTIILHIIISFISTSFACAQVVITNQVIGSSGNTASIGINRSWAYTLGEAIIGTANYDGLILTQGFHQPKPKGQLQFEIIFNSASCPSSTDGDASVFGVSGCTPPYTITWSNGQTGNQADRLSPGLYSVTVTSIDCELTETFTIEAGPQEDCVLRFFNAFSPNGDAINETWNIENILLPEFRENKVEIFNRWGQPIWSGNNYNNADISWDGNSSNGAELPAATYFYIAEIGGVVYKGFIELTR